MPRQTADARDRKRQAILDAAIHVFSAAGYYRTRITDIARTAGVADGTVYLYFASKEAILSAVFEEFMSRMLENGRRQVRDLDGAMAKLRRVMELHLDGLGRNPDLATVFQIELRHSARFMEAFSRGHLLDYFRLIDGILREGRDAGVFRPDLDTWFATKCIFGVLDEAATNWVLSDRNFRLRSWAEPVLAFVLSGLAPAAPSAPPAER